MSKRNASTGRDLEQQLRQKYAPTDRTLPHFKELAPEQLDEIDAQRAEHLHAAMLQLEQTQRLFRWQLENGLYAGEGQPLEYNLRVRRMVREFFQLRPCGPDEQMAVDIIDRVLSFFTTPAQVVPQAHVMLGELYAIAAPGSKPDDKMALRRYRLAAEIIERIGSEWKAALTDAERQDCARRAFLELGARVDRAWCVEGPLAIAKIQQLQELWSVLVPERPRTGQTTPPALLAKLNVGIGAMGLDAADDIDAIEDNRKLISRAFDKPAKPRRGGKRQG